MSVVDEIKDRIDPVEVIGETVKLRKSGKNYTGFCPFHPNTRTPAFVVFPESGTWRCFGACNEGGDVFSFLMKKEGWDFPETLRYLAERTGVTLKPRTPEQEEAEEAGQRLRDLLEATIPFYRHHLLQTPAGAPVLEYLHKRNLSDDALESFEIGYAPQAWEATQHFLHEKGYDDEEIAQAGMSSERESGGYFDRFRHRIMIPIRDARGRMAGFGARVVDPNDVPKFMNSPQTVLFDKGRLLYGLDKARKAIRSVDQVVIVEGYMDVIALHQAGYANVVSPMGTALTEAQLRLLKRFSRRIVLALDADAAGDQGTLRGLTLARESLERQPEHVFNARTLVRQEGRLDADIRVVTLPPGQDPDEIVAEDVSAWTGMLEGAKSVVDYVLEVLIGGQDLEDAKAKATIAQQVLPLIEDVIDPWEREVYRQNLARRLKVDERALLAWKPKRVQHRRMKPAQVDDGVDDDAAVSPQSSASVLDGFCLGLLLRDPELTYRIDRALQSIDLEILAPTDFRGSERQAIFQAVREALEQQTEEPSAHWRKALLQPLLDIAGELVQKTQNIDLDRPRVLDEVLTNFLRLRKHDQELRLSQLRFQLQSAQEMEGETSMMQRPGIENLIREVHVLTMHIARLDQAIMQRQGMQPSPLLQQGR
ncbi:MAG TPA: DNA primase [Anaerolineae bacterium]|nr:DNA primase [Anaerolineae bacterium]